MPAILDDGSKIRLENCFESLNADEQLMDNQI